MAERRGQPSRWQAGAVFGAGLAGMLAYTFLYSRGWPSGMTLLYDFPTNFLAARFYADLLMRTIPGPRCRGDGVRWLAAAAAILLSLNRAKWHWFINAHGHQTTSLILGLTEAGDRRHRVVWRLASLIPAAIVLAINLSKEGSVFFPETRDALIVGGIIGMAAFIAMRRATVGQGTWKVQK